jgi:hypothetical protein
MQDDLLDRLDQVRAEVDTHDGLAALAKVHASLADYPSEGLPSFPRQHARRHGSLR